MYYVYCITTDTLFSQNKFKIGWTNNLIRRKGEFEKETTNTEKWFYVDTIELDSEKEARKAEHFLHSHFNSERIKKNKEFFLIYDINNIYSIFKKVKNMKKVVIDKIPDGEITRVGESISHLIKTQEIYSKRPEWYLSEKTDDSIAAGAKNIKIKFCDNRRTIVHTDDGKGFNALELKSFAKHDRWHNSSDNSFGIYGIGSKDADRASADYKNAEGGLAKRYYRTSTDGKTEHHMTWYIGENKKMYENPIVETNLQNKDGFIGTSETMEDCFETTRESFDNIRTYYRFIYSLIHPNIYFTTPEGSGYNLLGDYFDPMHLDKLGENFNYDGYYVHDDGCCHKVDTKTFSNIDNGDMINLKFVTIYMTSEFLSNDPLEKIFSSKGRFRKKNEKTSESWAGLYFAYNRRYLSYPTRIVKSKHAYNRVRTCVFINNINSAKSLNVRSAKNSGIEFENPGLLKIIDEKGINIKDFIVSEMTSWSYFDDLYRGIKQENGIGYVDALREAIKLKRDGNKERVTIAEKTFVEEIEDETKKIDNDIDNKEEQNSKLSEELYDKLSDEMKNDLSTKYQYSVSEGSFYLKDKVKPRFELGSYEDEIGEYKWSIRKDVLDDDLEIKRFYNFYKEYKNKRSDYLLEDLNKYVISVYHFKNAKA